MTSSQRGLQVCLLLRVRGTAAQNWEQQRGVGNRGGGTSKTSSESTAWLGNYTLCVKRESSLCNLLKIRKGVDS